MMMIVIDFANADRASAYVTVDDCEPGYDPVKIARRLHDATPFAARVRTFFPGGSTDSDRPGDRAAGDVLTEVAEQLLADRAARQAREAETADEVPSTG